MSGKSKERSSAKRNQIVSTGDILFSKHGLRRVTVEEICRDAGVSKMTFYKYFDNKLELFKEIWTGWSDAIYERLIEMEKSGASFKERMKAIVESKMELLSRMNPEMIEDVIHSGPELAGFIAELRSKNIERFFELVADAREKGEMREIRSEFLLAALDVLTKLAENDELRRLYTSDMDFFRELNDFFFFGIMPTGENPQK